MRRPIRGTEVGKLKNGKAVGKYDVTGEIVKGGGELVIEWIWKLCNVAFESGVVAERSAVNVHSTVVKD